MAKLLQIAQLGNEVLRAKSKPVSKIGSHKGLMEDTEATMKEVNGVGIAARRSMSPRGFLSFTPIQTHAIRRTPNSARSPLSIRK